MKIESHLNNIFDQYDLEENRVTNAFLQTLAKNSDILKRFLNRYLNIHIGKTANIKISAQKEPFSLGDIQGDREKIEGIPDGWIVVNEDIAIVFEVKIGRNAVRRNQLLAHAKRIKGYEHKYLCVITPDDESPIGSIDMPNVNIAWIPWRAIYELTTSGAESNGIQGYFRMQLKEYLAMKEDLVGFQGIDYPSGAFNSREAKVIIKNLIKEIKPDILQFYPKLRYERKSYSQDVHAYTVYHRTMWSFLGADENFTKDIHLTFWLAETHMGMGLTIPNNAGARWMNLRKIFKQDDSFNAFVDKLFVLRKKVPNVYLEFVHRHYLRQRDGIIDGLTEMDLDTVKGSQRIKQNSKWLQMMRELVANKRGFNGQFMIRTRYFYKDHPSIKKPEFKKTILDTARSFHEIYNILTRV
ncbi:MAG: hypothetical protein WCY34_05230 [Candidatus Omnitrophota bacterium]